VRLLIILKLKPLNDQHDASSVHGDMNEAQK
jgi:hypothetical protein